ncbi:MAG: hypothetical protein WA919_19790 [Coleofasciculaceae cyanobacterium]
MASAKSKRAVGVFPNRHQTELALQELRKVDFPISKVSVMTRNTDDEQIAGVEVEDRNDHGKAAGAATGAIAGGMIGGLVGLIGALSAIAIPGVGPVVVGGAIASIVGDTVVGGALGAAAGGLVGVLVDLGIPEEHALLYSDRLENGEYLLILEGTEVELSRAASVLKPQGIQEWQIYDLVTSPTIPTGYTSPVADPVLGYGQPGNVAAVPTGTPIPGYPLTPGATPPIPIPKPSSDDYLEEDIGSQHQRRSN